MVEGVSLKWAKGETFPWNEGGNFSAFSSFDTGRHLYYIPLSPLWEMFKRSTEKPLVDLLLSLFAYLYQTVGIFDYTDDDNQLYYTYERLAEWYSEDDELEKQLCKELKAACRFAKRNGKSVVAKINKPCHLRAFGKRLEAFLPKDKKGIEFKELATLFYKLSQDYPNKSLTESFWLGLVEPEEEQRVRPDQYISFIWDNNDILSEDLFQFINDEINEIYAIDEPLSLQFFDRPQDKPSHDFSFEAALFPLLNDLIFQLDNF